MRASSSTEAICGRSPFPLGSCRARMHRSSPPRIPAGASASSLRALVIDRRERVARPRTKGIPLAGHVRRMATGEFRRFIDGPSAAEAIRKGKGGDTRHEVNREEDAV